MGRYPSIAGIPRRARARRFARGARRPYAATEFARANQMDGQTMVGKPPSQNGGTALFSQALQSAFGNKTSRACAALFDDARATMTKIRQWRTGSKPMPPWAQVRLAALLRAQSESLRQTADDKIEMANELQFPMRLQKETDPTRARPFWEDQATP